MNGSPHRPLQPTLGKFYTPMKNHHSGRWKKQPLNTLIPQWRSVGNSESQGRVWFRLHSRWGSEVPPNITHLHIGDSSPSSVPQAHICLHSTAGHQTHPFWLTLGLLELYHLLALPQQPALGGGEHLCWRYSPSFLWPSLLCPYSARLKQEMTDRKVIYQLYNLYPSFLLAPISKGSDLNLGPWKYQGDQQLGPRIKIIAVREDRRFVWFLPSKQSPERKNVPL